MKILDELISIEQKDAGDQTTKVKNEFNVTVNYDGTVAINNDLCDTAAP